MSGLDTETVLQLPPAAARRTGDIGSGSPCSACPLRHAAVHGQIDQADLAKLLEIATEVDLMRGQTVFTEGEPADLLFTIKRGTVMVYKMTAEGQRQVTGFLFDGDMLGLTSEGNFAYSAEAVEDSLLYRYPTQKAQALIRQYPAMERRLCEITRQELVEAQEQMLLLGRKTAKARVASFLLKLVRQAAERGRPGFDLFIPMTRQMIGDYLGITTETVSRTFTALKREGLISLADGHHVTLSDVEGLQDLAES